MHCSQSIALFNFEYCMSSIAVLHGQCIKQPEVVVRPLISSPPLHSTAPSPLSLIPNLHCKDCIRLQLRIALRKKVHHIHSSKLNWVVSDLISLHISICLALFASICVKKCNHLVLRAVGPEKFASRVFLTTSVPGIMYIWGPTVSVQGPNNPDQMERPQNPVTYILTMRQKTKELVHSRGVEVEEGPLVGSPWTGWKGWVGPVS